MPRLANSLNRPVIVAVPAFFGDKAPRRCVLVDVEPSGLWLSGDALNEQLRKFEETTPPENASSTVFFPFEQIAFVFDPAQFAYLAKGARLAAMQITPGASAGDTTSAQGGAPRRPNRPNQKNSKPSR